LGDFLKLGDAPRPPAGSILHLFFSGLNKWVLLVFSIKGDGKHSRAGMNTHAGGEFGEMMLYTVKSGGNISL